MRSMRSLYTAVVCLTLLLATACEGLGSPGQSQAPEPTFTPDAMMAAAAATATAPSESVPLPADVVFTKFDPANFSHSTDINNPMMPLKPGTRLTYDGSSYGDNGVLAPHRIVINVTDLTKMIAGVRTLVTFDQDISAGVVTEAELAFYAQDNDGNVWLIGEYPEGYENGKLVEAPTWLQGYKDARAGILMPAKPQPGTPAYAEGWGPAVGWSDRGQVDQVGQKVCVAAGCYDNVLVIDETSLGETNAIQLKLYAPNIGNIKVAWKGGGEKTKETLELTKTDQLNPDAMAGVRDNALKLEKSAYQNSPEVYAQTQPLEQSK